MSSLRSAALGLALVAAAAGAARAQTAPPTFSLEGNALYHSFQGRQFAGIGDGAGFELLGNVGVGAFSLGAGYLRTQHGLDDFSSDGTLSGPFVEPRLALPFYYRSFTPYLSARVARLTLRADDGEGDLTDAGTQLGGGVGMLVALAPSVRLNMGASYANLKLGDAKQGGVRLPDTGAEGGTLQLRVGLSLGAGGWGVH